MFGPGVDQPIVQYEGSGITNRRFLSSDERGSIIAATDSAGALLSVNSYDEYGKPGASNVGRFQYTGQMWLPEIGAYHYKARVYLPHLGSFAQTDPIGGTNLYAAMGGDPINLLDPGGMEVKENSAPSDPTGPAGCSGSRIPGNCGSHSGFSFGGPGGFGAAAAIGAADAAALAGGWAAANNITDAATINRAIDYFMDRGSYGAVVGAAFSYAAATTGLSYSDVSWLVSSFNRSGQPDNVIIAQIWKESRFNPNATTSGSTATGLMQVTRTAVNEINRIYGSSLSHSQMFDPIMNVVAGSVYLRISVDRMGGLAAGLNYYGTGPGYADSILQAARALNANPSDPMAVLRSIMP